MVVVIAALSNPIINNWSQQQPGSLLVGGQQNGEVLVSGSSQMNNQYQIANNNRKQINRRHLFNIIGASAQTRDSIAIENSTLITVFTSTNTATNRSSRQVASYDDVSAKTADDVYGMNDSDGQSKGSSGNQVKTIQYLNVNGQPVLVQFTYVGPPKILPIATADSYPEGSTINLICTVSGGQRKGLTLGWIKDGRQLTEDLVGYSTSDGPNDLANVSIEKTGVDISILRISNATHANSGRFTCTAKNPLGEDSTSVNIVINGE